MGDEMTTSSPTCKQADSQKKGSKLRSFGRAARAVVFCVLVGLVFAWTNVAFGFEGTVQNYGSMKAFYDLKQDSVDVAYIGTSATSRFFVNPLAYEQEGIASWDFGMNNLPAFLFDNLIDEVNKTQKPSLYVVELRPLTRLDNFSEENCRVTIDSLNPLSSTRLGMIKESLDVLGKELDEGEYDDEPIDYLFPVVKYRGRLLDGSITEDDLLLDKPYNEMQGFAYSGSTLTQAVLGNTHFTTKKSKLSSDQKKYLDDIIEYCDKLDAPVLFVLAPKVASEEESKEFNAVASYVESCGSTCLNFNSDKMFAELGLDTKTDFYNRNHTNYLGAEKYTAYLSKYLKEHYDLPDRRGDQNYAVWQEGVEKYKAFVKDGIQKVSNSDVADD